LARRLFGDVNPLGRRLHAGFNSLIAREIVGVVADEHHTGLGRPAQPNLYTPYSQTNWNGGLSFVVRSTTDLSTTVAAAREALRTLDPAAAIYGVRTLDDIVSRSIATERFSAGIFAAFALAALALALIGVYGVTDQAVTQRTHELGVRIALGADGRRIRALVIGGSLRLSIIGIVIGVVLGAGFCHFANLHHWIQLPQGVYGLDYLPFRLNLIDVMMVVAITLAISFLSTLYPSWNAARINPVEGLRYE
jgi:putative ABC transport system permease protein